LFGIDEEMSFNTSEIYDKVIEEDSASAVLFIVNTNGHYENMNYNEKCKCLNGKKNYYD
jgi:hypothetical protein